MKENEYQCAGCGGIFEKDWPDKEAWEEHDRNFPGESHETAEIICDDCYQEMIEGEIFKRIDERQGGHNGGNDIDDKRD